MQFQQIRNATTKVTYGGRTFLFDPMFTPKDGFPPIPGCANPELRWPTAELPMPVPEILAGVDAVIVTHCHIDHLDPTAIQALDKALPVFAQDETDAATLRGAGFADVRELAPEGTAFGGVTLCKTPCRHGAPEKAKPVFAAVGIRYEAMGVVLKAAGEPTLYMVGDTIWYEAVAESLARFRPDAAVINAARAETGGSGPIIMGLEDIAALHEAAPEMKIVASHLDTVGHATLSRADIRAWAREKGLTDILLVPEDGEILTFAA